MVRKLDTFQLVSAGLLAYRSLRHNLDLDGSIPFGKSIKRATRCYVSIFTTMQPNQRFGPVSGTGTAFTSVDKSLIQRSVCGFSPQFDVVC